MWTLTALGLIIFLLVINMILLMGFNDIPQHTALDTYNAKDLNDSLELANSLQRVRLCLEDVEDRLTHMEEFTPSCASIVRIEERIDDIDKRLTYHIQSTNELKPKA